GGDAGLADPGLDAGFRIPLHLPGHTDRRQGVRRPLYPALLPPSRNLRRGIGVAPVPPSLTSQAPSIGIPVRTCGAPPEGQRISTRSMLSASPSPISSRRGEEPKLPPLDMVL